GRGRIPAHQAKWIRLLCRIDAICDCVAMEPGMLAYCGPPAWRGGCGHGGRAFAGEVLPRVIATDRGEGPLATFDVLQKEVAWLNLARGARCIQRLLELFAMARHRAMDADHIHKVLRGG